MNKHLVFIYGTLRRDGARPMPSKFPNSTFVAEAKVSGNLYDLGSYPGLQAKKSSSSVYGEVYEVDDDLLKKLDEFEATSDYWRKEIEVSIGADKRMCWTYQPKPELCSGRTIIESGDWIEYAKTKSGDNKS